jgi:hypothetical protein
MQVDFEHKIETEIRLQCEDEYLKKLAELRNELEAKYAKELGTKIEAERKNMTEQFDELTNILKKSAEEEQVCLPLVEFTDTQVCMLVVCCTLLQTWMELDDHTCCINL